MKTLTRDDTIHGVEYVTKHEAQLEIDDANHRGMIADATLRNEITSIKQELKHHLDVFEWMDGPEGWADSCQRLNALLNALPNGAHDVTEGVGTIRAMRDALKEAETAFMKISNAYDGRFFRAGKWANEALAKLKPFTTTRE